MQNQQNKQRVKTVAVIDQSSIARPVTQNIATPHYNDKASPLHAPKGLENKPQMNGQGINPIFRRTFWNRYL